MKKTFKVFALVLALSMIAVLAAGTAFAAGSKQEATDVSGDAINSGEVVVEEIKEAEQAAVAQMTEEKAADIINHEGNAKNFDIVDVFDLVDKRTDKTKPVTLTFTWTLTAGQRGYVFHYTNGAWKYMGLVNTPIVFKDFSPVAIVVESNVPAAEIDKDIIADTGDNNLTIAIICAAVVAIGAAGTAVTVSLKKKKA